MKQCCRESDTTRARCNTCTAAASFHQIDFGDKIYKNRLFTRLRFRTEEPQSRTNYTSPQNSFFGSLLLPYVAAVQAAKKTFLEARENCVPRETRRRRLRCHQRWRRFSPKLMFMNEIAGWFELSHELGKLKPPCDFIHWHFWIVHDAFSPRCGEKVVK